MKSFPKLFFVALFNLLLFQIQVNAQGKLALKASKPNIILIVTDDLGYGDLGVFYQNLRKAKNSRSEPWMETPNLDQLANSGAMLTDNYCAAPVCAPSRASMLLGVSQGHANVRDNQFDKALEDNYTIANVLKSAGYATAAVGKWGLQGLTPDWPAHPLNRGFDYFFGYMRHGDGHEHYPKEGLYRKPKQVWENRTEISSKLDKCYTGDLFTAVAKRWITENVQKHSANPFFLFLAYDNPHAALELPTQAYPEKRGIKGGVQWLGQAGKMINTASGSIDSYVHPSYRNQTYDHDGSATTAEIPWPDTFKRYATIVRRIDDQIGDLIALLKDLKIYDNTLVVFTSDNGASIESYLPKDFVPNRADFFNSFGPFDGIKRDVWEGGMRMPTIVAWPKAVKPNIKITSPSISYDFLPTFAEAAGIASPVKVDGISLIPELTTGRKPAIRPIYTEYFEKGATPNYEEFDQSHRGRRRNQMQMIRVGDTLGIRYNIKSEADDFELYDIRKDPQQSHPLGEEKNLVKTQRYFKKKVLQMRLADSSASRPYDNAAIDAAVVTGLKEGISWQSYEVDSKWIPKVDHLTATRSGIQSKPELSLLKANTNLLVFEGFIEVREQGSYQFRLAAGGKAFLKVHDISLIDEDFGYQANMQKSQTLTLKAGYHPIKLFFMRERGIEPKLDFQILGASSAPLPLKYFIQP